MAPLRPQVQLSTSAKGTCQRPPARACSLLLSGTAGGTAEQISSRPEPQPTSGAQVHRRALLATAAILPLLPALDAHAG
jgi:hypothetical protein